MSSEQQMLDTTCTTKTQCNIACQLTKMHRIAMTNGPCDKLKQLQRCLTITSALVSDSFGFLDNSLLIATASHRIASQLLICCLTSLSQASTSAI